MQSCIQLTAGLYRQYVTVAVWQGKSGLWLTSRTRRGPPAQGNKCDIGCMAIRRTEPFRSTLSRIALTTCVARAVGLSTSPCLSRGKTLESLGYIQSYGARIALDMLGDHVTVFTEVKLTGHGQVFQLHRAGHTDPSQRLSPGPHFWPDLPPGNVTGTWGRLTQGFARK